VNAEAREKSRIETLQRAASERARNKRADVERALMRLRAKGDPFDLATLARVAGCSTSYLYKHADIVADAQSTSRKMAARSVKHGSATQSSAASLATKLGALTSRIQRLSAENARLSEENKTLRGEVLELSRVARR